MPHCFWSILKTQIQEYTRVSCSYVFVCSTQLFMKTVLCHENIYPYKECRTHSSLAGHTRSWTYKWTEGNATSEWTLLLENGVWFFIGMDGIRHLMPYYSNTKFYYSAKLGRWCDLGASDHSLKIKQWSDLATRLLPCLNDMLMDDNLRARTVKDWSYYGCTRRYGDVTNRTMELVVDMALELNKRIGAPDCWEVARRNREHKAVGFPTLYLSKIVVIQIIHSQKTTILFKNIFLEPQNCFL